jgi:Uma2 family endonuclease
MSISTSAATSAQDWGLPSGVHCRFTVEQYLELAEQNLLGEGRCELLDGWIVPKSEEALEQLQGWDSPLMVRSSEHDSIMDHVEELLRRFVPPGWYVRSQKAMVTSDSVPEPDVAMIRGKPSNYYRKHAQGTDLAIAVEISLSTLTNDRRKARIFALSGVPKYVIVNVRDRCLELFERPVTSHACDAYTTRQVLRGAQAVIVEIDHQVVGQFSCDDVFDEFPATDGD